MPFTAFESIEAVADAYQLSHRFTPFTQKAPVAPLRTDLRDDLDFAQRELPLGRNEASRCESLIFPLLLDTWKPYRDSLTLWSHEALSYDAALSGTPDYMVARRSPRGVVFRELPYLIVVEAKRDEFLKAGGQCLAAMLTAQKLNGAPDLTVYGIVTNGVIWEFSNLQAALYTQDPRPFTLAAPDDLHAALHYLMQQCRAQVVALRVPA